jgi:cytoskeletal protein RodZ
MTLVIVVAAIGALVLLVSILALSRSRFADESDRFRYVSDLTSKWSRQQQMQTPDSAAASPASPAAPEAATSDSRTSAADSAIDLREAERGARRS